jgi:hypothetical protein
MGQRFRSALTANDLISAATVTLTAGQYTKLGEYKVQAGETVEVGFGVLSGMDNAIGRIYALMQTSAPAEIKGKLRLQLYSPQDRPLEIIWELRTEALNTSSSDRTKQTPLPECNIVATEDKKIVLEFLPDSTATLTKANCTLIMDTTVGIS